MTASTEKTTIIARIEKLLRLSRSPNEHEATAAMEAAQKLLLEHNLEMDSVDVDSDIRSQELVEETLDPETILIWKRDLLHWIARLNFCSSVSHVGTYNHLKGCISLYGRRVNVEATKYMYAWIMFQVERLADKRVQQVKDETVEEAKGMPANIVAALVKQAFPLGLKRYKASFAEGCCYRVWQRLDSNQRKLTASTSGGTAMVLARLEQAEAFRNSKVRVGKGKQRQSRSQDHGAWREGHRSGDEIKLTPGTRNKPASARIPAGALNA